MAKQLPAQSARFAHLIADAAQASRAGRLDEAKRLCLQVIAIDVYHADGLHLLGVVEYQAGHYEIAAKMMHRAIAVDAGNATYHCNLGLILQASGKPEEATVEYKLALKLKADYAEAHSNLGNLLRSQGKRSDAKAHCEQAVALRPENAEAHNNLGNLLHDEGNLEEAEAHFERALALRPANAEFHNNLAIVLWEQGKTEEAQSHCEQALAARADYPEAHNQMGILLRDQGKLVDAQAHLERALALEPNYPKAENNLGMVLRDQGKLEAALVCFERVMARTADNTDAQFNLALTQLLKGNYTAGWPNYESRYYTKHAPRRFSQPLWRGEPLDGAQILIHAEQGLGDVIQFLRYLPMVQSAGGRVALDVPIALHRIALELPGVDFLTVSGEALPAFECHCPLMSLPLAFQTTLDTIPTRVSYLFVPDEAARKANSLPWPHDGGLRVGLVWAGNPKHTNDRCRSITLSALSPLLSSDGVHFFSLQMGSRAAELDAIESTITDLTPAIDDMADTAALMMHLDLVITVDTSVAHMAGALARPVWMLVPFAPDWRWLAGREDSPWYPTMRLFRQSEHGNWQPVIARICAELAALADGNRDVLHSCRCVDGNWEVATAVSSGASRPIEPIR